MQEVRLWEVGNNDSLREISASQIAFEERLEDWLTRDISMLDSSLMIIGRQVRTDFGGFIDLLCLDNLGNTVVIELKKGQTPRETTAQVLEYTSWVRDLPDEKVREIGDRYVKDAGSNSLREAFVERLGEDLPEELNLGHRSLIVAESIDDSTDRIVRYLADMNVPINVATIQHFTDSNDRRLLAQVFLVEPEKAEAKSSRGSRRGPRQTIPGLQAMAEENGIGELYSRVRMGVRGLLRGLPYRDRVFYQFGRDDGGRRTALIVWATPHEEHGGLGFTVHVTRLEKLCGANMDTVQSWLPPNSRKAILTGWSGSSEEEKRHAEGYNGAFTNAEEVDKFVHGLRTAFETSTTT